jgi:hypothetical protein
MMNTYIYDKPRINERLYMGLQASTAEQKLRAIETLRGFDKTFGQEKSKEGERKEKDMKKIAKDQGKKGRDGRTAHEGPKK